MCMAPIKQECLGAEPAAAPIEQQALGWKTMASHSEDTITSGIEGAWIKNQQNGQVYIK